MIIWGWFISRTCSIWQRWLPLMFQKIEELSAWEIFDQIIFMCLSCSLLSTYHQQVASSTHHRLLQKCIWCDSESNFKETCSNWNLNFKLLSSFNNTYDQHTTIWAYHYLAQELITCSSPATVLDRLQILISVWACLQCRYNWKEWMCSDEELLWKFQNSTMFVYPCLLRIWAVTSYASSSAHQWYLMITVSTTSNGLHATYHHRKSILHPLHIHINFFRRKTFLQCIQNDVSSKYPSCGWTALSYINGGGNWAG